MVSRVRTLNLRETGQWEDALASATTDIEKRDGEYVNLVWRGLIYRQLGQIVLAIADFTQAMRWEAADPYYFRGNAYLAMARYDEAEADHKRYLDMTIAKYKAEIVLTKEMTQKYGGKGKPDPRNYRPLDRAFCLDVDCQVSVADCELAIAAGHRTPLVYFCKGVAYEACRDFYPAIATYQQIESQDAVRHAAQIAIARAQESSCYVDPSDKKLMRPGIEYLRVTTDYLAKEFTCEYFDLNNYRKEVVPYWSEYAKPYGWGWQTTAERIERETSYRYCQRPISQGLWGRLKSKLSLS
jgi:tetratricopeptide (TPR) repeat protein